MPKEMVWNNELVQKFWDYYSDKTETYYAETYGDVFVQMFKKYIDKNSVCLDYGCGSGGLVKSLLKNNTKTIAIDDNKRSVELIKKRFSGYEKLIGAYTINSIKKNEKADLIFSLEAIEHVLDENLDQYFQNIKSLLSENGLLIISCPNDEDIENGKVYCPVSDTIFHPTQHVRSLNKNSIKKFVENYGFNEIKIFETDLICHPKYSVSNWLKMSLRNIKASITGNNLYKPHLIAIFKRNI